MGANGVAGRLESAAGEQMQVLVTRRQQRVLITTPGGRAWEIDPTAFDMLGERGESVELLLAGRRIRFVPTDPADMAALEALLDPSPALASYDIVVDLTEGRNEEPEVFLVPAAAGAQAGPERSWLSGPLVPTAAIGLILILAMALLFWPGGNAGTTIPASTVPAGSLAPGAVEGADDVGTVVTGDAPAPAGTPPPDETTLRVLAGRALSAAGFADLTVRVDEGVATVGGQVPPADVAGGFFAYERAVGTVVGRVDGIDRVRVHLQLRGDETTLRTDLSELTDASPVEFASGQAGISSPVAATLDRAADIILGHPGLRVLVAGHADPVGSASFNEDLSNRRAQAVVAYLVSRGVPANRLTVVAYGELFTADADRPAAELGSDRRVEFEVAA